MRSTHNPLVEAARPGYCVHHADNGWWWHSSKGWVEGRQNATVFSDKAAATRAVKMIGGSELTTVPRHNGYCVEWRVITVESVDDGWVAA